MTFRPVLCWGADRSPSTSLVGRALGIFFPPDSITQQFFQVRKPDHSSILRAILDALPWRAPVVNSGKIDLRSFGVALENVKLLDTLLQKNAKPLPFTPDLEANEGAG